MAVTPDPTHNAPLSSFTLRSQILAVTVPTGNSSAVAGSAIVEVPYIPGHSFPVSFAMPDGEASGTGLVTADEQFFRYSGTLVNGNPLSDCGRTSDPAGCNFILVGGVPTPSSGIPTGGFATYQMAPFFTPIPFTDKAMFGSFGIGGDADGAFTLASGVTVSPMYVARSPILASPAPNNQRATHLQASLGIVGLGKDQRSFLVGESGEFFTEQGSTVALGGEVVGSLRAGGQAPLLRIASGVGSVAVPGGNAMFGPNANYLVLGPDGIAPPLRDGHLIRTTQAGIQLFFDTLKGPTTGANLQSGYWSLDLGDYYHGTVATQDSVLPTFAGMPLGTQRTTQTLLGYTAGVLDRRTVNQTTGAVTITPVVFASGRYESGQWVPGVAIATDASTNRLTATFDIAASSNRTTTQHSIQFGNAIGADSGRGAFVDDFIFAARESTSTPSTVRLMDFSVTPSATDTVSPRSTRVLMIPSNVVPGPLPAQALPGVTLSDPDFLHWGWWTGEIVYSCSTWMSCSTTRDRFHLATWVAGVMPTKVDLPTVGTATYTGHLIGNVADAANNRYIAAGTFSLTWNFTTKSGTVDILGFDPGGSLGASGVTFRNIPITALGYSGGDCYSNCDPRRFSGSGGAGSVAGFSGSVNGSFCRSATDPRAGVNGDFLILESSSSGYRAAGIFGAERSALAVPRDDKDAPAGRAPRGKRPNR